MGINRTIRNFLFIPTALPLTGSPCSERSKTQRNIAACSSSEQPDNQFSYPHVLHPTGQTLRATHIASVQADPPIHASHLISNPIPSNSPPQNPRYRPHLIPCNAFLHPIHSPPIRRPPTEQLTEQLTKALPRLPLPMPRRKCPIAGMSRRR
jgi:hypothetical protein